MDTKTPLSIVIFANNLRTDDNLALQRASHHHLNATNATNATLIGLYSLEILEGSFLGHPKFSPQRRATTLGALLELQKELQSLNISLYIVSSFKETLQALAQNYRLKIFFSHEVGSQERKREELFSTYEHESFFEQILIEPFAFDPTKSFSHFKHKALKAPINPPQNPITKVSHNNHSIGITSLQINEPILSPFTQKTAHQRVAFYFKHHLHHYETSRWLIDGQEISTQFSPYLSLGILSPKRLYESLKAAEAKYAESSSSRFIFMELLWRDFFHLVMEQSGNRLFLKNGLSSKTQESSQESCLLERFYTAQTGEPLIDAGVKELRLSGWLSNRMRQLLANYFCKVLGLDFRYGAAFFESFLLDYNPAANWGNWAYQAGVGNDKRDRVFDFKAQCARYGGDAYIKKWESLRV